MNGKVTLVAILLLGGFVCSAYQQIPEVNVGASHSISQFTYQTKTVAPVLTISKQEIKRSGAKNIAQVLALSGLQQRDLDGDGSNLQMTMRGFGSNTGQNVLVLLNGSPLSYPDLGTFNFNEIAVQQIQAVKIYTHSMGVFYGNQAVAGVINIITKAKIENTQHISMGIGSFDTYQAGAGINRQLSDGYAYRFNISGEKSRQYRQHNKTSKMNASIGVNKHFKHSDLALNYQYYQQYLNYPGALTAAQLASNRRQSQTNSDTFDSKVQNLQARYQHQINNVWQFKLASLIHQMNGKGVLMGSYHNKRAAIDFNPSIAGELTMGHYNFTSLSGLALSNGSYRFNSSSYNSDARQTIYAGYTQLNLPIAQHWQLITGGRYAKSTSIQGLSEYQTTANDSVFVSNIGALWQPNTIMSFYLRRAGNYRFPKTDENIDTDTNKPLHPQTGVSYETGVSWQLSKLYGLLNVYHMDISNEISSIPIPNSTTSFALNQNLPKTKRDGFSVNLAYKPWQPLTLQIIYHYVNAKFSSGPDKNNAIPFVADQTYVLASIVDISPHWRLNMSDNFTGARRYDNDPEQRSPKISAYSVVNANLEYHRPRWQLGMRVNNVFNELYNAYAFDVYNGAKTTSYYYPAMGINFMVNLNVQL